MADRQRQQDEANRDRLYADYMDAASTATDYINSQIAQERANAALLGVDYQIDDAQKQKRISDYFSTLWGEGQQSQLESLMDKVGAPQGFEGFLITRGDGSTSSSTGSATGHSSNKQTWSTGLKPKKPASAAAALAKSLLPGQDETLGAAATVLGG